MITLKIQLISLAISAVFGLFFAGFYRLNYNYIYNTSNLYKIVINILFCTDFFLFYFVILKKINYGIVHLYFFIIFFLFFFFGTMLLKNLHSKSVK